MGKRSMFVGMDVHKESIDVSLAEEGRDGEVRHYGVITGDVDALAKVVRALRAPDRRLRFVYEAGPCGFGIHRYLTAQGEDCGRSAASRPGGEPSRSLWTSAPPIRPCLGRGSSATNHSLGGTQPADISSVNRR